MAEDTNQAKNMSFEFDRFILEESIRRLHTTKEDYIKTFDYHGIEKESEVVGLLFSKDLRDNKKALKKYGRLQTTAKGQ